MKKVPAEPVPTEHIFHLVWRTTYVIFTATIAMYLPFSSDIVGILGAFGF
jgi:hypothetical protein